ncbi:MAG: hypothetical protein V1709_11825, partial [Planctomycetota bacterium]
DTLTYTYSNWLSSLPYTVTDDDQGTHTLHVDVSDGRDTRGKDITVTVNATAPPPQQEVIFISDNRSDYGGDIPKYEKFEVTFDIKWKNLDGTEYDPVSTDPWSDAINYKAGNFVAHNEKLYKCKTDLPLLWRPMWRQGTDQGWNVNDIVRYNNAIYRAIKATPAGWDRTKIYKKDDQMGFSGTSYISYSIYTYINNTPKSNQYPLGNPTMWQETEPVPEPGVTSNWQNYWELDNLINGVVEPGKDGAEYWQDLGIETINPYWPYDPNPPINDYWRNPDRNTVWNNNTDYTAGKNHVTHNGTVYAAIKNTPRAWALNRQYYTGDEIRNNQNRESSQIYIAKGTHSSNADNAPTPGGNNTWTEKGNLSDYYEPNVSTNWTEYWRANPPDPVPAGKGITVNGIITAPDGSEIVQPAFIYQDFKHQDIENSNQTDPYTQTKPKHFDWLYPQGNDVKAKPVWKIRFTPTQEGQYHFQISVEDRTGKITYNPPAPINTFSAIANPNNHGFVKVSQQDPRYFETTDDTYLNLLGMNDYTTTTFGMDYRYSKLGATNSPNGAYLLRPMWFPGQGPSIFGMQTNVNYFWKENYTSNMPRSETAELFSGKIEMQTGGTYKSSNIGASINPNTGDYPSTTRYLYSVWLKAQGIAPKPEITDYGIYLNASALTNPQGQTTALTKTFHGDASGNSDWQQISTYLDPGQGQRFLTLKVNVKDVLGSQSFESQINTIQSGLFWMTDSSLREDLTPLDPNDAEFGPELLGRTDFDSHKSISQQEAWKADYQVETAKKNGIYLKPCLMAWDERVFSRIAPDGTIVWPIDQNNVYAEHAESNHASRIYQQYLFRYLLARWGYSTAIHSFEFVNEGNPSSGFHYSAVQKLAKFVKENDPNKHLVSTSLWHSYPTEEFWDNPAYPDVAFADWHLYTGPDAYGSHQMEYYGWPDGHYHIEKLDDNAHSPPNSFHISNSNPTIGGISFVVKPNHKYRFEAYIKGVGVNGNLNPTIRILFKKGPGVYSGIPGFDFSPDVLGFLGDYGWKKWEFETPVVPENTKYVCLVPKMNNTTGDVWFDDIRMFDLTEGGVEVEVPNGTFDEPRTYYDTALMNHEMGVQVGANETRAVAKPLIRGETAIAVTSPDNLADDTDGIWYKKFVWSLIEPYGVIPLYYDQSIIYQNYQNTLDKYAKSYQKFMSGIPLNNGKYEDAKARVTVSSPALEPNQDPKAVLRAWGQKDLANNRAHLWIDNIPYNWKRVVDANTPGSGITLPPPVSGTVTIPGFAEGNYTVEWWDTSTGEIVQPQGYTQSYESRDGNIVLTIPESNPLVSDVAVKIYPAEGPPSDVTPPSKPSGVTAVALDHQTVRISWNASTDNIGVTGYTVNRNGNSPFTASATSYTDSPLTPETIYNYTIVAFDAAGNISEPSDVVSVTTPKLPDTTPPVISGVTASGITQSLATIRWTTDEPATSQVRYGLDATCSSIMPEDPALVTSHSVDIAGLSSNTAYHYRAISKDRFNNTSQSIENILNTLNNPPDISFIPDTITKNGGEVITNLEIERATDPDPGDTLIYTYSNWLSSLPYTVTDDDQGTHTLHVDVSDGRDTRGKDITV